METENYLALMNHQQWMKQIQDTNQYTEKFGLKLSQKDAEVLIAEKANVLKAERRVEFGPSVLPKIIFAFCDSSFVTQENYLDTLLRLQEIFFLYKNEMCDEITDEELLTFMREQFDDTCYGDLDYLEGTCLEIFGEAIRAGYRGYLSTGGKGDFSKMDIVERWDKDLYLEALRDLCWK